MLSAGEVKSDCDLFRGAGGGTVPYSVCVCMCACMCMLWACFCHSRTSRVPEIMWNSWEECRAGVPSCHLTPSLPASGFLRLEKGEAAPRTPTLDLFSHFCVCEVMEEFDLGPPWWVLSRSEADRQTETSGKSPDLRAKQLKRCHPTANVSY